MPSGTSNTVYDLYQETIDPDGTPTYSFVRAALRPLTALLYLALTLLVLALVERK